MKNFPTMKKIGRNRPDKAATPGNTGKSGFTLTELLVALAALAVVAPLLLASVGGVPAVQKGVECMNNVRQLNRAWQLYAVDHNGKITFNADEASQGTRAIGSWCEGVLSYAAENPDNTNTANFLINDRRAPGGNLGVYAGRNPRLFKCPSDASICSEGPLEGAQNIPRVRTVSMNVWMNSQGWDGGGNVAKTVADIVNPGPSESFVFCDENPDSINDACLTIPMASNQLLDFPANFHQGGAAFSYADGHADIHLWLTPALLAPPTYQQPENGGAVPNNPDRVWLQTHSGQFSASFVLEP